MARRNFLLGKGENLTEDLIMDGKPSNKKHPYTFDEAKDRLLLMYSEFISRMEDLPEIACPNNEVVAALVLHPAYLAKSYYPEKLIKTMKATTVGSRPREVILKDSNDQNKSVQKETTQLFLAGNKIGFREFLEMLPELTPDSDIAEEIIEVEDFFLPPPKMKIQRMDSQENMIKVEAVLHSKEIPPPESLINDFHHYLEHIGINADLSKRIDSKNFSFICVDIPLQKINAVAQFSFLRCVRQMYGFRQPSLLANCCYIPQKKIAPELTPTPVMDDKIKVAVLDGGLPSENALSPWVNFYETSNQMVEESSYTEHGFGVTSALIYGSIDNNKPLDRPYAKVDHYRVIYENSEDDPLHEMYPTIKRIVSVLEKHEYEFVNLSLGPDIPIDDDEVNPWTALIDPLLSDGKTLLTVAAGNAAAGRIGPPADCVNALSIGASDRQSILWEKAVYSCKGPGRSLNSVKPDGLAFGGSDMEPFLVFTPDGKMLEPVLGTSYAAPNLLRTAIGVRTLLGEGISPLAIRALLVHTAETKGFSKNEVGWGGFETDINQLIQCTDRSVTVIYQKDLEPGKYIRAEIPVPDSDTPLKQKVWITATICIATKTDPDHPSLYTRSAIEVIFRKNKDDHKKDKKGNLKKNADSTPFFSKTAGKSEGELRKHAAKWQPIYQASQEFWGRELLNPVFDIHHIPRIEGRNGKDPDKIPFAMIITIKANAEPEVYDKIVARYRGQLEILRPRTQIPLQIG